MRIAEKAPVINVKLNARAVGDGLVLFCIYAVLVLFAVKCISVALTAPFSFDGARIAEASDNLVGQLGHLTPSNARGDEPSVIDVSTGIPVTLPVAILFVAFGESFVSGLAVNAIYMLWLILTVVYFLKYCVRTGNYLVLLGAALLYLTPGLFSWGFGLYGEIPALFYFLVTLILMHKSQESGRAKYQLWAGVFFALATLTKTVMLIAAPSLIFVGILDAVVKPRLGWQSRSPRYYLGRLGAFLLGFLIPMIAYELFKLSSLGYAAYVRWWDKYAAAAAMQAGVKKGLSDTAGILPKFEAHLRAYSAYVDQAILLPVLICVLLFFLGILAYGLASLLRRGAIETARRPLYSSEVLVLMATALSYFGWWLFITPTQKAWYRRIVDGTILLEISLVIAIYFTYKFVNTRFLRGAQPGQPLGSALSGAIWMLLMGAIVLGLSTSANLRFSFENTRAKTSTMEAASFIAGLPPDAELFGFGWWEAPVLSFASGRDFKDILKNAEMVDAGPKTEKYLVVDQYASSIGPAAGYQDVLDEFDSQLVYSKNSIAIYRLDYRHPLTYPPFTAEDRQVASHRILNFAKKVPYNVVRNVYLDEDNPLGRWAQNLSGYLLKYDREQTLDMYFWVPDLSSYNRQPFSIKVFVNNRLASTYRVERSGDQQISVPLEGVAGNTIEISVLCNASYITPLDGRELSILVRRIVVH